MRSTAVSVDVPCGYVTTMEGMALEQIETCKCEDLLVIDGCYQCSQCGTIYGLVHGWARLPRRNRRRSARVA